MQIKVVLEMIEWSRLQVFAIELVTFEVNFAVPLAVEFGAFAQ